ncbi:MULTISPECIES: hypothetical protein [unclassified Tenacibaculum]|uniref:hypothetical protein n=1 Tax=unclassified Tenacibaculum TaxID=2635139 RepID=UPI001F2C68BE|nr:MULTISPECIES: hypothetical protein [unclassified Tenacibaculum]MCF2875738.1 hypothetical protein [Tenacibaculum sp. Cn5-1]MCF2935814.1 hypothetical protein [Tenacibaculum sp. Cn5-34]MCG7512374.1 hypothetical protein [Tenacibaculum sp. Cn5-46]
MDDYLIQVKTYLNINEITSEVLKSKVKSFTINNSEDIWNLESISELVIFLEKQNNYLKSMGISKVLKQKAYEVLINKIDIETFEGFIYKLTEKAEFSSNSLLFDIVSINYKSKNSKKELKSLIKKLFTKNELLSLNVYENCLKIIQYENIEEFDNSLKYLSDQYVESNYEYNVFYNFYRLNNESVFISEIGYSYSEIDKEQIIKNTKEYSKIVIDMFNFYKENEDWDNFLTDKNYNNFNYAKKDNEDIESYIPKKRKTNKFYDSLLNFLGLN